jgi:hypothetical protein
MQRKTIGVIVSVLLCSALGVAGGAYVGFRQVKQEVADRPPPKPTAERKAVKKPRVPRFTGTVPFPEYRAKGPLTTPEQQRGLYLDLMKMSLTDLIYEDDPKQIESLADGKEWPNRGMTMIGIKRLDNLHMCMEDVLQRNVPGDFIEAGAWRGGATIFMAAVMKEYGVTDRTVWVADSFEGLPPPNAKDYPQDLGVNLHMHDELAVSIEEVQENFKRFGLLDKDRVKFLKGWFKDTLGQAPIDKIAILRLDGDLYESTMDTLGPLYPKVVSGGYVIVDDRALDSAKQAVDDYRKQHGITEELKQIDWTGWYWQKK